MGHLIIEAIGDRGKYGDGSVAKLSEQTGLHQNTIYECRRFAQELPDKPALEKWIQDRIDEDYIVVWKHVRGLIWQSSQKEDLGLEGTIDRRLRDHERESERLAQEMQKTIQMAQRNGVSDELKDQTIGVAQKMIEVANSKTGFEKPLTIVDQFHLNFVRSLPCAFCEAAPPSEPHHFTTAGVGIKGSDFGTVPVCRSCHNDIHKHGLDHVQKESQRTIIMEWGQTLYQRLTGERLDIPSSLRKTP